MYTDSTENVLQIQQAVYGVHDELNLYTLCSLYVQSIGHLRHGLLSDICGWVIIGWQNHREMRSITRFDEERAVEPRTFCGPLLKRLFFDYLTIICVQPLLPEDLFTI